MGRIRRLGAARKEEGKRNEEEEKFHFLPLPCGFWRICILVAACRGRGGGDLPDVGRNSLEITLILIY